MSEDTETTFAQELGRRIKERRLALGIERQEIADRLNLTEEAVRAYEEGRAVPRLQSITLLVEILQLDLYELLGLRRPAWRPLSANGEAIGRMYDSLSRQDFKTHLYHQAELLHDSDRALNALQARADTEQEAREQRRPAPGTAPV